MKGCGSLARCGWTCCFGVGRLDCPEVSCNEPHLAKSVHLLGEKRFSGERAIGYRIVSAGVLACKVLAELHEVRLPKPRAGTASRL